MSKTKRPHVELRYYDVPQGESCLALLGDSWKRNYGNDTTCQHFHNLLEIGFCRYGSGILESGEQAVFSYSSGTLTFFPANMPHNTISATLTQIDFWEYLFIDVPSIVQKCCAGDELAAESLLDRIQSAPRIYQAGQEPELSAAVLAIMEELRRHGQEYSREIVSSMVQGLMFRLARTVPPDHSAHSLSAAGSLQIRPALNYVSRHYAETIRIEDLANACHLSETHFRRIFMDAMGMAPLDFINLERIQRACDLLKKTNDSMEMIATRTGFVTQSSFNRTFLKLVGTTPYHWKHDTANYGANSRHFNITAKEGWF